MIISNFNALAATPLRRAGLEILNAGLEMVLTDRVLARAVRLRDGGLEVGGRVLDLRRFNNVYLIGFGKVACDAARALEQILGDRLAGGRIIDIKDGAHAHPNIVVFKGTHPKPSAENVRATGELLAFAKQFTKDDLVLVVVSGGGSALLCSSLEECNEGQRLYEDFIKVGGTIRELNLVRRHLSTLKGGGLAQMLYPVTVMGLIFCDVPGGECGAVASGPTYYDASTADDAKKILEKYGLFGYVLNETPKEKKYFANVVNVPVVSNLDALNAMCEKGKKMGFKARILETAFYNPLTEVAKKLSDAPERGELVVAGGEPRLVIPNHRGQRGGRNTQLALEALRHVRDDEIVISCASDGLDNTDAAGAIADKLTAEHAAARKLNPEPYRTSLDSYTFFKEIEDLIFTGQTGANVADIMLSLRSNRE